MSGRLFVICGASGSGKSTLTSIIEKSYAGLIERAPKYSTRAFREKTPDNPVDDDIIHVDKDDFVAGEYDLAYVAMKNKYGIKFSEITERLNSGANLLLVMTDFRAVYRIKMFFNEKCATICLLSAIDQTDFLETHGRRVAHKYIPDEVSQINMRHWYWKLESAANLGLWADYYFSTIRLLQSWQSTIPEYESVEIRTKKVRNFQTRYFENSHHFDFTILNYRKNKIDDMLRQFNVIYETIINGHTKKKSNNDSVLLVVAAASGSGKGTLTSNLKVIAPNEVCIVPKQGMRAPNESDKDDGLEAIGEDGQFSKEYNIHYQMHRDPRTGQGTKYAFSEKLINNLLKKHKIIVAIANVLIEPELLITLKAKFKDKVRVVYLMRFGDTKQIEAYQKSRYNENKVIRRMKQMDETYEGYISMLSEVDHILLNTEQEEDMYDQMFRLIEQYQVIG